MKKLAFVITTILILAVSCAPPPPEDKSITEKHNYIVLLDLSDRLIVQKDQPNRDKELLNYIYAQFEERVKKNLFIRSRDEIRVVIAPQKGSGLYRAEFEDKMYVNMDNIPAGLKRPKEEERRTRFLGAIDTLYQKAIFSKNPTDYYGADIWKYFYEDLKTDYSSDTLTKNFLFILTDGYPIVGKDLAKLQPVKNSFPDLKIVLIEAAPRDKDMEWDRIQELWQEWFNNMGIKDYQFIKRTAISKEKDIINEIMSIKN
jgi:hypothetical protein